MKHRSRQPEQPNLRQVHLLADELLATLRAEDWHVRPGDLGENVTTTGVELSGLSVGSILEIGSDVILAVTGRRAPCAQAEAFAAGLRHRLNDGPDGHVTAGAMAVVVRGGIVRTGDPIVTTEPTTHRPLRRV